MNYILYPKQATAFLTFGICSILFYFAAKKGVEETFRRYVKVVYRRLCNFIERKRKPNEIEDKVCFSIARSLRAGTSLESAVLQSTEEFSHSQLLFSLNELLSKGIAFSQSVDYLISRASTPDNSEEKIFLSTVHIAKNMGGNSARIFEKLGGHFTSIYDLRRECSASLTQVKLSTIMISLLPVAMLLLSNIFGTNVIEFMFTNPIGYICLFCGATFQILGLLWMRKQIETGVSQWLY